ncbi:hypothetical protein PLICRDRAFT_149333 [Plicaturopsis crispa FD-325 SS-3]|nr:hypothetical protein PLICRDRAFT_149333 [Plicaturopsis crispa FD-325 SS-3]
MLASPLYPASFSSQQNTEDSSHYRPARDIEAFNKLLPPPIEFVEGSSSGSLAVAEGKYEPINGSPKASKTNADASSSTPSHKADPPPNRSSTSATTAATSLYTRRIDETWPTQCTVGAGLYNTGNTCFLNSVLQCLLHTPPLIRVLFDHSKVEQCPVPSNTFCMACSLRTVMFTSYQSNKCFTPQAITSRLQTIAKHMRRGRQEDAHEFLRYAIDAIQKSCLTGHPPKLDPKIAETTWVHKIFGGRLRSRVSCRECGHNSDTFDSILDLSLDIHGVYSLRDALKKFVAIDYLKGADKYKCEKCKRAVVAEKRFTIHQAPMILTVHLKRFSPLGRKIGHPVRYDEHVSLKDVMSEGEYGPSYSLYGIVCHAGGGPNSGHYIAYVKGSTDRWYEMNDDMVTPIRSPPLSMKNAYILFYSRNKGQALEAAVASAASAPAPRPSLEKGGLVAGMKKRKAVSDDEDTGVKASAPFIGPVRPSTPSQPAQQQAKRLKPSDPQADAVKKKIAQVSSVALSSLSQYKDDDDSDDSDSSNAAGPSTMPSTGPAASASSSATAPTTSPAPTSSPNTIPTGSFYGSSSSRDKKRKSPDSDELDDAESKEYLPLVYTSGKGGSSYRNIRRGNGTQNPHNRLTTNNFTHPPRRGPPKAAAIMIAKRHFGEGWYKKTMGYRANRGI